MIFKKSLICAVVALGASSGVFAANLPSGDLLKDPNINQIWQQHLKDEKAASIVSKTVLDKVKEIQQSQAKLVDANYMRIEKALKSRGFFDSKKINVSTDEGISFNALRYQIADCYAMLDNLASAANSTRSVLLVMRDIATAATSGVYSQEELNALNAKFQSYKTILPYLQSADLIDGYKVLNGGTVKITIGATETSDNTLTLNMPAINSDALGITNLAFDTQAKAQEAVDLLNNVAIPRVTNAFIIASSDRAVDAETMLQTIAPRLDYSFALIEREQELAVQAANGIYNDEDRDYLNIDFTDTRDTMTAVQSYISLSGLKKLGGGDIHIQIGSQKTPETTLTVKLPVTDVHLTGFDTQNIKTQQNAYHSLDATYNYKHHLVYNN